MRSHTSKLSILLMMLFIVNHSFSQGVIISSESNATPNPSAMLDVQSSEKGFLPPRMATSERNAIISPANGLVVYDTNEESLFLFNGTEWEPLVTGSSSRWEADGNNIFRNTGNVGIGVSEPEYLLHLESNHYLAPIYVKSNYNFFSFGVQGEIIGDGGHAIYGLASSGTGSADGVFGLSQSNSGRGVRGWATANSGINYGVFGRSNSPSGHGVYGWASASTGSAIGVMGHVNSSDGYAAYFTGGSGSKNFFQRNVGIGTDSPSQMLEVVGNIVVSGWDRNIFNISDHSLSFGTNNTARMRITNDGNVGIGMFSPAERLVVDGNIHVTGGDRSIFNSQWYSLAFGTNNTERMLITSLGLVGIGTNSPQNQLHVYTEDPFAAIYGENTFNITGYGVMGESSSPAGVGVYGLANATIGDGIGVMGSVNSPNGFAGYFTGPAGSRNYFQRSVGIGTNFPNELLEVNGNIHVSGGNRTMFNRSNNSLAFGTNNTQRMIITNNGNIGVATSNPNERLEVAGNIHVSGGNRTIFNRSNNSLAFGTNNLERMRITSGGNVGIGTQNPGYLLHVRGSLPSIMIESSGTSAALLRFLRSGDGINDHYIALGSIGMTMSVYGAVRMTIRETGNIGIGTDSPSARLHIRRASSSSTPQVIVHNSSTTGFARFRLTNEAHEHYWDIASGGANNYLDFYHNGNGGSMMTLRPDLQFVGIRTINPTFTLHVNGNAGKPGGGSWANASDARLKSEVQDLQGSLENILKLRGVTYLYNDPEAIHELPGERIGMIAQEVAEVFPDWVDQANDGYLRLTFRGFEALVVEALRELKEEKDTEIAILKVEKETTVSQLHHRIFELEEIVSRLAFMVESQLVKNE